MRRKEKADLNLTRADAIPSRQDRLAAEGARETLTHTYLGRND